MAVELFNYIRLVKTFERPCLTLSIFLATQTFLYYKNREQGDNQVFHVTDTTEPFQLYFAVNKIVRTPYRMQIILFNA